MKMFIMIVVATVFVTQFLKVDSAVIFKLMCTEKCLLRPLDLTIESYLFSIQANNKFIQISTDH